MNYAIKMTTSEKEKITVALQEAGIKRIQQDMTDIKNNINDIAKDVESLKEVAQTNQLNIQWLLKFFWVIVPAVLGSLVMGVFNLLFK